MFGTGTRFAEYGITGSFFIVTQTLLLGFAFPDALAQLATALDGSLGKFIAKIPTPAQHAFQSLLIALALLSVFICGLLLELAGSYYVLWEAGIFETYVEKNRTWIIPLLRTDFPDYLDDYELFAPLAAELGSAGFFRSFKMFAFWSASGRQEFKDSLRRLVLSRKTQRLFRRLEYAFVAKVAVSGAKIDLLMEQLSICRMSRAITLSTVLLLTEAFFFATSSGVEVGGISARLLLFIPLIATMLITMSAYSRLCLILFSLLYTSAAKQESPAKAA